MTFKPDENTDYDLVMDMRCKLYCDCKLLRRDTHLKEMGKHECFIDANQDCPIIKGGIENDR